MPLKKFDVDAASALIATQIDLVTCLECCKFYIAPERATCGHALCHCCWVGRRTCPYCAAPLKRKELKLDPPLTALTKHVQKLAEHFGQLFGLSISDFAMEVDKEQDAEKDPSKHVKAWLASSDNHFSAPLSDTQQSSQNVLPPLQLTSKVQIHAEPHQSKKLEKIVQIPARQDEWDKIDVVPDTEEICAKNKENAIGPMDLEPFYLDEFTDKNPRRSSRQRENSNYVNNFPAKEVSENHMTNNSGLNVDKKQEKAKQNWTNVKKMKKEFRKLNKINKSKLNVSIEMCKKTQSAITSSKLNAAALPAGKVTEEIVIEDNTPVPTINASKNNKQVKNAIEGEALHVSESVLREPMSQKESAKGADNQEHMKVDEGVTDQANNKTPKEVHSKMATQTNDENHNPEIRHLQVKIDPQTKETPIIRVPFFKKSTFQGSNTAEEHKCSENESPAAVSSSNPDDIFITIRIGDVVTNITINRKQNDVQLKVNTDRGVQTSLSPKIVEEFTIKPAESVTSTEARSVQQTEEKSTSKEAQTITQTSKKLSQKPSRTKKNTASADTGTGQCVITESVEKELSNVMECEVINNPSDELCDKHAELTGKVVCGMEKVVEIITPAIIDEMEEDIFNSGSVKELNSAKLHAPSEILIPTRTQRTNRNKTQKSDKRERDTDDIIEDTSHKRRKLTPQDRIEEELPKPVHQQDKPATLEQDSLNYDDVMSQVFANIDADIKDKSSVKKVIESKARITSKDLSQFITQKKPHLGGKTQTVVEVNLQKESENMFSTVGNALEKGNTIAGPETQQHIANLLTPRMCEELVAPALVSPGRAGGGAGGAGGGGVPEENVCTPAMDDMDDVVEETPQKDTSSTKSRSDPTNRTSATSKKLQLTKPKADEHKTAVAIAKGKTLDSQDIGSIINLTDTIRESLCPEEKETINPLADRKTLDTPLTINKFFDNVTHNSTPISRKSLNFSKTEDEDLTLCPDPSLVAKTTQEKEFMAEAFDKTTPVRKPLLTKNVMPVMPVSRRLCIAGSCLKQAQVVSLKQLCARLQWTFVDKYVPELTHLVVTVDEYGRAQRSVKYMCALAAGKWIVSHKWIEKCIETNTAVEEEPYEALDSTGDAGPRRSRMAPHKLFRGITFYCMPPFSVLDTCTLNSMLQAAGGTVVTALSQVRVNGAAPAFLLAEPEHTQEDRFTYMAIELSIVPVNYEWALNCLGSYFLYSAHDLLLCQPPILPQATASWPPALLAAPEDIMESISK